VSELHDMEFLRNRIRGFDRKTVLVTGATGFFGLWMTHALYGRCNLVLAGRDNLTNTLKGGDYDYIFHFAPTPIEPVIECARRNNAVVVYASSGAVYGGIEKKVSESSPTFPKTDYGKEKLRCEFLLKTSGVDYRIARLFTFCGTNMRGQFAVTAFVDAVKHGKDIPVFGGGRSVRTYLYIMDAIVWLTEIAIYGHGIYNVGSERETTIFQLAKQVSTMVTPTAKIYCDPKPFIDPAPYYVPDCTKAHNLGLYQWHNLEYGLRKMLTARSCYECEFRGDTDRTHCIECSKDYLGSV